MAAISDDDRNLSAEVRAERAIERTQDRAWSGLLASAAWDLAGEGTAAQTAMDDLRRHLDEVDPPVLVEALLREMWPAARAEAERLHAQTRAEIDTLAAPASRHRAPVEYCPDPAGHHARDIDVGRTEASLMRIARGCCGWCSKPVDFGQPGGAS